MNLAELYRQKFGPGEPEFTDIEEIIKDWKRRPGDWVIITERAPAPTRSRIVWVNDEVSDNVYWPTDTWDYTYTWSVDSCAAV